MFRKDPSCGPTLNYAKQQVNLLRAECEQMKDKHSEIYRHKKVNLDCAEKLLWQMEQECIRQGCAA